MGRGKSYCKPQKLAISHLLAVSPVPAHRPCRLRLADARQPRSRLCVRCDTLCRLDTRRLDGARAAARCTVTSNGRASDAAAVTPLARALMRRARGRRQRRRRDSSPPKATSCIRWQRRSGRVSAGVRRGGSSGSTASGVCVLSCVTKALRTEMDRVSSASSTAQERTAREN